MRLKKKERESESGKLQAISIRHSLIMATAHAFVLSHFSCVRLFATLWTVASQTPLSMGFSRQEYWSGSPCPPPGDLPSSRIESASLVSPALAGGFFTTSATWEAPCVRYASMQFTPKSPGQSCYKLTLELTAAL